MSNEVRNFTAIGTVSKAYDRHKRTWILTISTESTSGLPYGTKTFSFARRNGKVIKDGTRYKFWGYYWTDDCSIAIEYFERLDLLLSSKKTSLKWKHEHK